MIEQPSIPSDSRMQAAVSEMQRLIRERFPGATFNPAAGEDPGSVWLWATVDVDDPDKVLDLVTDRLLVLNAEDEIPLLVIPVRTPERRQALLRAEEPEQERVPAGTASR